MDVLFEEPVFSNFILLNRIKVYFIISGRFTHTSKKDLQQYIRYSTAVRRVEYNKDTDDFTVITKDLKEDRENTERFTHVVVASGLFTVPKSPEIPGIDTFKGRVLHAKEVKHIDEFKNQRVLVVGSFISAEDLSVLLIKFGAKDVIISYKYRPLSFNWPEGISERPLVVKVQGNTAYFKDGTEAEFDAVIFATGYRIELPFISEDLRLKSDMLFYPENLYKGILWMNGGNDKLMYIGLIYNVYHFNVYEAQAIWACRYIMGKIQLPPRAEMQADIDIWTNKVKEATKNHDMEQTFVFIEEYFRYIVELVGYNKDVLKLQDQCHTLLKHRLENVCNWRDEQFRCIFTGSTSSQLSTPWMTNFDDKLEEFVNKYK